jgi:hypothetical protein
MNENKFDMEQPQINIQIVETPPISEEYQQYREQIWDETQRKWSKAGKDLFNGTLYRFMGKDGNTIRLGLMTYADRLVRSKISIQEIRRRFGVEHIMKNCCVDLIPITTDRKVVVGVKKNSVDLKRGKLGYIGGNMNTEEVSVSKFEDIYTMMIEEIKEESNIVPQRDRLSFSRLGITDAWASFYFTYNLEIHSASIGSIFKEGEFTEFVAMTPEEIKNTEKRGIGDFNLSKDWIDEVV